MSRGPRLRVAHARLAAALGALGVACSSGLGDYHLVHERGDGSAGVTVTGSGGNDTVGGAPSEDGGSGNQGGQSDGGGNQGGQSDGGGGGTGNRGAGGTAGASGGRPMGGSVSAGGLGAGGVGAGGVGNGGMGTGGVGMGGGSGGRGGTAGVGAGGLVSTGGAGGMGTGGTGGIGDPVLVTLNKPLSNITAAAWSAPSFYMLEGPSSRYWRVDPEGATVAGPYPLPTDIYSAAFGVSPTSVYAASKTKVYRVPAATGSSTAAGVALTTKLNQPSGAYAGGYFLIGDMASSGATGQAFSDATNGMYAGAASMGTIYQVASDATNFAFYTFDTGLNVLRVNRVAAGSFSRNSSPCRAGIFGSQDDAISVAGTSVAWVVLAGGMQKLSIADMPATGVCPTNVKVTPFGSMSGPNVVGLIDANEAMVFDSFSTGYGKVVILGGVNGRSALASINPTNNALNPQSIIIGAGHYAAITTGDVPSVFKF